MPKLVCTHVEVYVFRRRERRVQFLALKRSADRRVLPGVWQPVTGKLDAGETAVQCAVREVREETGFAPRRWWALKTPTLYFDASADAILALPLFAAEVDPGRRVTMSEEHEDHRFLPAREAGRRFLWESQRRGLEAVRHEVLGGGALARELEITHLIEGSRGSRPLRRSRAPRLV